MSKYQEHLKELRDTAVSISSSTAVSYRGCYIHGACYDGVFIYHVYYSYGIDYHTKSLIRAEQFVDKMRRGFGI